MIYCAETRGLTLCPRLYLLVCVCVCVRKTGRGEGSFIKKQRTLDRRLHSNTTTCPALAKLILLTWEEELAGWLAICQVGWLHDVLAKCTSGMGLLRQVYVLISWATSLWLNFINHPLTAHWHRTSPSTIPITSGVWQGSPNWRGSDSRISHTWDDRLHWASRRCGKGWGGSGRQTDRQILSYNSMYWASDFKTGNILLINTSRHMAMLNTFIIHSLERIWFINVSMPAIVLHNISCNDTQMRLPFFGVNGAKENKQDLHWATMSQLNIVIYPDRQKILRNNEPCGFVLLHRSDPGGQGHLLKCRVKFHADQMRTMRENQLNGFHFPTIKRVSYKKATSIKKTNNIQRSKQPPHPKQTEKQMFKRSIFAILDLHSQSS